MGLLSYYFPQTRYNSILYDLRVDNNPYVIVGCAGPSTDAQPVGVLDPRTKTMSSTITKPGTGAFGSMHTQTFNGVRYLTFMYSGNTLLFFNAHDPSKLTDGETYTLTNANYATDFVIYQNWAIAFDYLNENIMFLKLASPVAGFQFESNIESQFNFVNPLIVDPAASLSLYCAGSTKSLLTKTSLNVLDTTGIDMSAVVVNQYVITAISCSSAAVWLCIGGTCNALTVGKNFTQNHLTAGHVYINSDDSCLIGGLPTVSLRVDNGFGGHVDSIQLSLTNVKPVTSASSSDTTSTSTITGLTVVVVLESVAILVCILIL